MHKYLVELRIIGEWLDEKEISRRVGFEASQFVRKGDLQFQRVSRESVWQLDARPSGDSLEWLSLEDGLTCLLEKLIPVKAAIDELKASCDVSIVCGHFASGFGGGATLSPIVLELLARLGIKLTISSYCSHGESDSAER
jgi:Domain of unknown function (DUF4279)